jgi:hypothetical protein
VVAVAERAEVEEQAGEEQRQERAPLVLRLTAEAQKRLMLSTADEVAVSGGWFSGKTYPANWLALSYAAQNPGARVAICREERAAMTTSTLKTMREEVMPSEMLSWHGREFFGWKESESTFFLPRAKDASGRLRQSTILFVGLDRPERLLSSGFALIIVDQAEQISFAQFQMVSSRAGRQQGMPDQRIVLLFNADGSDHWANKRYQFDRGNRIVQIEGGKTTAEVINCGLYDNWAHTPERYKRKLEALTGNWRTRYRLNQWTNFEGSIFETWNWDVHTIVRPSAWDRWGGYPPPNWMRARGLDFGFVHPFVCSWFACEPSAQRWFRYREIHRTGVANEVHAATILREEQRERDVLLAHCANERERRMFAPGELRVTYSFSDHARQERETFSRAGVWTEPAEKDVMAGIQTLLSLLDPAQPGGPRLLFVRDSLVDGPDDVLVQAEKPTCTEEEMGSLRWQKPRASGPDAGEVREVMLDLNDDGFDATRYLMHSMAGDPQVRVVG